MCVWKFKEFWKIRKLVFYMIEWKFKYRFMSVILKNAIKIAEIYIQKSWKTTIFVLKERI